MDWPSDWWRSVLILIVVEDGLVLGHAFSLTLSYWVLILIVVEDGLVRHYARLEVLQEVVLILIVVEDGLVLGLEKMMKADLGEVLILIVVEDGLVPTSLRVILRRVLKS